MKRYENILTMPDALSTKVKQPLQAQSKLRISSFIGLCTLLVQWNKHQHLRGIYFRIIMPLFSQMLSLCEGN